MVSNRGWRAVALGLGLTSGGIAGSFAWGAGMWGSVTTTVLICAWLLSVLWWNAARLAPSAAVLPSGNDEGSDEEARAVLQQLLLDTAPTPLVALEDGSARALNRAARRLFGTDARIIPLPPALADPEAKFFLHEGHRWRIDRVTAKAGVPDLSVAALIDIESEANLAEARASAELIEVLGHELLNGLAPIVSLAESAQTAAKADPVDGALLGEILGPLARRAESLQRFAEAYRQLSRLPVPVAHECDILQFARDLHQGFIRRWPQIYLGLDGPHTLRWPIDRDQLYQAIWALLHNAAEAVDRQPDRQVDLRFYLDGARLVFDVLDTGTGVNPAKAVHIFRPFHTTKPGGSGIGLSLARQIAQAHGGTLELAGANPTTFRLTVPEV